MDLHTDAFYASRASDINHRLVEIGNGDAERLIREVDVREREKKTCIIGLDWSFDLGDLIEIVGVSLASLELFDLADILPPAQCFDGEALATICKVVSHLEDSTSPAPYPTGPAPLDTRDVR